MENEIKALVTEFFEKLEVEIDSIKITNIDEANIFNIKIKTEESGLLIWPHWKNLDALQNILKLISSKKIWERVKLHIEINDYVKTKDDRLLEFIKSKVSYLEKTWKEIKLPFYSAYERKKIHWFVWELNHKWIFTKSDWEWKERRLYIYKEAEKLTIDIDWDDI